jgi:hypothetical protein
MRRTIILFTVGATFAMACADESADDNAFLTMGESFGDEDTDEGGDGDGDGDDNGDGDGDGEGDGDGDGDDNGDGDGDDSGDGDGDGDTEPPDCSQLWQGMYIPSQMYMTMKQPETAEEMFCYTNMERINYQFHGRNSGCIWSGGNGGGQLSWPYEMEWDPQLAAAAQEVADDIAAGGPPPGTEEAGGYSNPSLWVDGCATAEYTVSSKLDDGSALSNSNGSARMGVHYYDPGANNPTLTRLGVGMSKTGDLYNWVLKFGE